MLEAPDYVAGIELLHELECTDGLPVVLPTQELVEAMTLTSCLALDLSLGTVPPAHGAATIEKIAAAAVMAGCLPEHFPVVLAAAEALCDPALDLGEVQATTHNLAPLLIVNGPARAACGNIASGYGALGPGRRANAAIGRAVRLMMINIGGGRPGTSDMAQLGHPGKFTYCLAEGEETSPFPPLHTTLGYDSEQSAVTVVCVEAPHSVQCITTPGDATGPDRLLNQLASALANCGSNNHLFGRGAQVVVLNPDHARLLANAKFDRGELQLELARRAVRKQSETWATRADWVEASPTPIPAYAEDADAGALYAVADPSQILILVAGGEGTYSAVMPSWGFGPHDNTFVTREVVVAQACEIPAAR
jgi:hypothetical protein